MATYRAEITTQLDAERAFSALADFANAADWDPATVRSFRLDGDDSAVGEGSRFQLDMKIAGRENSIVYEIVEFAAPRRVVLRGENAGSVSVDEIIVEPSAGGHGARIVYAAEVTLKGAFKAIAPVFGLMFRRMGDGARDSMHDWLDRLAAASRVDPR